MEIYTIHLSESQLSQYDVCVCQYCGAMLYEGESNVCQACIDMLESREDESWISN